MIKENKLNPFKILSDSILRVEKETPSIVLEISKYGWYFFNIDSLLPREPFELQDLINQKKIKELDDYFINYFNIKYNKIKDELITTHPKRKLLFEEIFSAYTNKLYFSAISLSLTQIDGICFDEFEELFFVNDENYLPKVLGSLKQENDFITNLFLSPIENKTSINVHEKYLGNYPINLNRHSIIHGKNIEYGNKVNSIKLISFLSYISYLIKNNRNLKQQNFN